MGLDRNTQSVLSFVYLMCKYSVYYEKSRIEDIVLILMVDHHFFRPRNTLYSKWAERYLPQSDSLIEDWKEELKHCLCKMGRDKGMKGLTYRPSQV